MENLRCEVSSHSRLWIKISGFRMKRLLLFLVVGLLLFSAWFIFIRKVTIRKEVAVPYSLWRTGEQLNNTKAVARWYVPFFSDPDIQHIDTGSRKALQAGPHTLYLENVSSFGALYRSSKEKSSASFLFTAVSDTTEVSASRIQLTYRSTLIRQWLGKTELEKAAEQSLQNLREYMTDTKRFYGYEIQEVKVEDTAFLFSRVTVPLAEKRQAMVRLFDKLIAFAQQQEAGYNGSRIFYSMQSGNNITLFAGVGVTVAVNVSGDIEYKRMPYGKNLLQTSYQGPFGQSGKAFEALELFKTDHKLSSMAIPYQKILSDGYDFADDQMVQLKIYYPVF